MMRTELLKEFYLKVQASKTLEAQAMEAVKEGPAAIVELGRQEGYDFTEDEVAEALASYAKNMSSELSDADLDLVAGGTSKKGNRTMYPSHWLAS
ncbi:Nif11-like leader peptide family RiPP precursor [Pleomorphomonas sp. NRK KF1]|uniref:Nif11-like leader peptide family RiPP precursor n=1 Tax=Pleomorphomonas sp. NRK KF1 TaxID=2943000 RepID=UPI00204487B3|nr:Nif11-like leader peptide family RiPP precursor [Pleomorphomonas sp. NRK KF1]MCM5551985.1 Nif11-like leader peptide family RiPP precursor [Pleomorphomonas sp. NRK KF1]